MNRFRGGYDNGEVERYRRAHERSDREPVGHYERAGFGYPDGYRGAYAERSGFYEPYVRAHPDGGRRPRQLGERQRRALADRELARNVDLALYDVIGSAADSVAVYAADAVVTLEGALPPRAAEYVLSAVRRMPGVRRVRNALRVRGR